jgi:uncharacterized protein (UPF0335 family)
MTLTALEATAYVKAARELFAENQERIKALEEEQANLLEEVPELSQEAPEGD